MATDRDFPLHRFPRKLMRSLVTFAGAGTLMAFVVWSDGEWNVAIPVMLLVLSWLTPAIFAFQIKTRGFDPLERLQATEASLVAHYRDGHVRTIPWPSIKRLLHIEGFRHRSWAIVTDEEPLRWYGELAAPEDFAQEAAARTGLAWEMVSSMPDA